VIYKQVAKIKEPISAIGVGCWNFGGDWDSSEEQNSINIVHAAIDLGVNLFDVAPVYGWGTSETVLGKALRGKRDKVLIASKGGLLWDEGHQTRNNLSKKSLLWEIDESLARLGTDYVDIYQLHWPDPATPLEETAEALEEMRKAGKIRYVGLSNFGQAQAARMMELTEVHRQQGLVAGTHCLPPVFRVLLGPVAIKKMRAIRTGNTFYQRAVCGKQGGLVAACAKVVGYQVFHCHALNLP